jgi:hypothetical protein
MKTEDDGAASRFQTSVAYRARGRAHAFTMWASRPGGSCTRDGVEVRSTALLLYSDRAVGSGAPARSRVARPGAVGSRAGRTCQPLGSIPRVRRVVVEREPGEMDPQGESGKPKAAPGVDPRHGHRCGHRRAGVTGASEPGTGPGGESSERGAPPPVLRQRPGDDQRVETGRPGPHGIRPRRDVVRASGGRGGAGEPSRASEHEPCDEPGLRAAALVVRPRAEDFRGSRREHGSRWIGLVVDRRPDDGAEHPLIYPGRSTIASVTFGDGGMRVSVSKVGGKSRRTEVLDASPPVH